MNYFQIVLSDTIVLQKLRLDGIVYQDQFEDLGSHTNGLFLGWKSLLASFSNNSIVLSPDAAIVRTEKSVEDLLKHFSSTLDKDTEVLISRFLPEDFRLLSASKLRLELEYLLNK